MKANCLLMAAFLATYSCAAQNGAAAKRPAAARDTAEKDAVSYVKAIDVKTLDPALPSQGLEQWLKSGSPHFDSLTWALDETCDLRGDLDTDYPRCVRIGFSRSSQSGYILILIGTLKKGIIGPPKLYEEIGVSEGIVNKGWAERLSKLPALLVQPAVNANGSDLHPKSPTPEPPIDWNAVNALRSDANNEELAFGKSVDVHQLDSTLPTQHLEDWLKSPSLRLTHIEWESLKCNIHEGPRGATRTPEGRLCASVWFQRGNSRAQINVSSIGSGNARQPKLDLLKVSDKDAGLLTPFGDHTDQASDSGRLSDLPRLLDEQAVIDVTRSIYDAVVARHPVGIPAGPDKLRINPLLSKRLRAQLEIAQACETEYLSRNPRPAKTPYPAWFKAGLFSGEGALASPGADLVDRKTRQPDGSFLVFVWLSRKAAATDSAPPESRWINWHVEALVKSEEGKFVVDDVRLFGDNSPDSPSRLLSESFSGCDLPLSSTVNRP